MNESEARRTLLVRAFEAPLTAPWTEADRDWASREARQREGAQAVPERLIATRAALASQRLSERDPAAAAALAATAPHAGFGALLLLAAFATGVALDSLGALGRIEILSPPLLALLAWNLGVYLWLLVAHFGSAAKPDRRSHFKAPAWLVRFWRGEARGRSPALARFAADWASRSGPMQQARVIALLHAGAALLALGALASLYLRGTVFEFRAGWDSTFFDAGAVHAIAAALYGPASFASGIAIPNAEDIALLRFAHGNGGNAAQWIHLQALTVAGAIVLPRVVLGALARARAQRLAREFPLPLTDSYYRRLLPRPTEGVPVCVLPYSYHFPEARLPALRALIEQQLAARAALEVADSLPPGAEDDLDALLPPEAADAQSLIALFALTATPEHETHGAFVRALAARAGDGARLQVMVDETDFRARFGADGGGRLAQRRDAWRRLLDDAGVEAQFVDLSRVPEPT
jgi:hypothetical protein